MIALIDAGLPKFLALRDRVPHLGRLFTPRNVGGLDEIVARRIPWAADNDAYSDWDPGRFVAMLARLAGRPGCLFVSAPDEVGDARLTRDRFESWAGAIRDCDLPVAYVAQDGLDRWPVPWSEIDALFIGGTTEFKLGDVAARAAGEARERDLWVHMGRVNTVRRLRYAASVGCDSIDGTKWSRFTDTWIHQLAILPFEQGRLG